MTKNTVDGIKKMQNAEHDVSELANVQRRSLQSPADLREAIAEDGRKVYYDSKSGEEVILDNPEIDLSKIANYEALRVVDRDFSKVVKNKIDAVGKTETVVSKKREKFSFDVVETIPLPSHGKFYIDAVDEDLKKGYIKVRPMCLADEEILTNSSALKSGSWIRKLYDSCIVSDYPVGDLLTIDSNYIFYLLRKISYGDEYNFEVTCPECKKKFDFDLKISELSFHEIPDWVKDPTVIRLPRTGYLVEMVLPRIKHSEILQRILRDNPDVSEVAASYMVQTLSIRDPKGNEVIPSNWIDFYSAIPTIDRAEITKAFKFDKDIDQISATCPNGKCGEDIKFNMPIGLDFFRLS